MRFKRACLAGFALVSMATAVQAGRLIADNEAHEPADEQKLLHVPPGFEVQLVACEPDIHKPININFDDRGRLWVTDTVEYPFPAAEGAKTRDTVKVLEDFGPDGKARKITTFADNLNIPVGVLPRGDNSVIVYSIPGIWHMTDTTGSGHADQRKFLLGTFGHDDTHGQTGSFTEGYDGWIYAVHGFRNTSTVTASDGSSITMQSGNTYRFKPDGSHVEQFTHGQVNPFGMCFDPYGNLFTSDCETMPIALMMRESYHPSFGKPDDGLGFEPEMCDHMYGSTAIAGLCDYVADQFPPEYRNRMFVGNVVTNRINAAQITPRGSGFHADDSPDFLTTDDQWFRPTCIKLGPDGALYVTDFYNRIIGHYEVDLHHPGRDKQKGRIWRIVYKGNGQTPAPEKFDLTKESIPQIVEDLASPNLTIRMLAMNRLADVIGQPAVAPLKEAIEKPKNAPQKVHGLWVLFRLGALNAADLKTAAADADPMVRQHAMRMIGEISEWKDGQRELALAGLKDADPMTCRMAAEALARHPQVENVRPLLDVRERKNIDPDLIYGLRIALRDQLQHEGVCPQLSKETLNEQDKRDLADVAVATTGPEAAGFLLQYVRTANLKRNTLATYLRTIVRSVPEDQADDLAKFMQSKFPDEVDLQLSSFKSMIDGLGQRGAKPGEAVRAWGTSLAGKVLSDATRDRQKAWTFHPLPKSTDAHSPWGIQTRASADGDRESAFLSSNVNGETLTGVARSPNFVIPAKLTFFLAGHNGQPPAKHPIKNFVELRDAKTNEILAKQAPPRHDVAQQVTWDLSAFAGREGYIEATDGDKGTAYAWLAFGRFDPPVVPINAAGVRLLPAVQIVQSLKLTDLAGAVEQVLADDAGEVPTRVAAADALGSMDPESHTKVLATVLGDANAPDAVRDAAAGALGAANSAYSSSALVSAMATAPERMQLALAKALATGPTGAEALLDSVQKGKASARLLQDQNVLERLGVAKPANLDARVAELTKGLPAADAQIQKLIDSRAAAFDPAQASPQRGRAVFEKTCMVCHMIGGKGAHVGPQLDGIGVRGVPRLCEDILDPSRNVDVAFRYSTFVLADGNVIAGIPRKEEGQTLTVADSTGKEVAIDKSKITRRVESKLSLMPSNFGEIIPPADFNDLMSYLLSTSVK